MNDAVMTRQQRALSRLKTAYNLNRIPVPPKVERQLKRLASPRLEMLADHWERRYQESLSEKDCGCEDTDPEPHGVSLLDPGCPIKTMIKVLRRMSAFNAPPHSDRALHTDLRYHGSRSRDD